MSYFHHYFQLFSTFSGLTGALLIPSSYCIPFCCYHLMHLSEELVAPATFSSSSGWKCTLLCFFLNLLILIEHKVPMSGRKDEYVLYDD